MTGRARVSGLHRAGERAQPVPKLSEKTCRKDFHLRRCVHAAHGTHCAQFVTA